LIEVTRLPLVREFWDQSPCDGQSTYALRAQLRYGKDPWLQPLLRRIAARHSQILEIGCGQGTDALTICQWMDSGGGYTGVDLSPLSLASARLAADEVALRLKVKPLFKTDNAECLQFESNSCDGVLSVGVLHHTENTERAISEVRRVLAPHGTAYVCLYRMLAPKLMAAYVLRGIQRAIDTTLHTDRSLYRLTRAVGMQRFLGTAIHECFGVPILRSYTATQMRLLFRDFSCLRLSCHGVGLPPIGCNQIFEASVGRFLGYLWLAEATK
jgi:ubiquinone/menaquinone biosynthesis C-methylase UbiE